MSKLQRLLAILGLATLVALPVRASWDDDDYDDLDDDVSLTAEQRLTESQKKSLEAAARAAKLSAAAAERAAKVSAAAAERAVRTSPKLVRDAVKAQGKYNVELAKLGEEQGVLNSLTALATELGTDLTGLPTVQEILTSQQAAATEDAAFYRSLIPMTAAERAAALATRSISDDDDEEEFEGGLAGIDELQMMVIEATVEYAEELGDVAEAYAQWQDKLALSLLSSADYRAELARRATIERARKAELLALPRTSQVWLRKAWSAEEDAAEAAAALEWIGLD
jgi:hypothetical protein